MRLLILALFLNVACGEGFEIEGTLGQPVSATFDSIVPRARVRVEGQPDSWLLVDSGSPVTVLDTSTHVGLPDGLHTLDVETLGVTFRRAPVAAWDLPSGLGAGIIGADLLAYLPVTLDYRGGRIWLGDPSLRPVGVAAGDETVLAAELRGGGLLRLPGCGGSCGSLRVPPTRLLVRAYLEDRPEPIWLMLDSGASMLVLDESLLASLGGEDRPRLDGALSTTVDGETATFVSRLWRVRLAGADLAPGASVTIDDTPVKVHPGSDTLRNLSRETGVEIGGLAGGMLLRGHLTTIDFPGQALRMARYHDAAHIPPGEWVGVGFTLERAGEVWRAKQVFTGRDAETQGMRPGDLVVQIDDTPISDWTYELVDALLDAIPLGERVPVTYVGADGERRIEVLVEDLLPGLPPPGSAGLPPSAPALRSRGHSARLLAELWK